MSKRSCADDWHFDGFDAPYYTQVPDALFDEVMSHLSGAELKVLLYILRRTFGFKKDADAISLSQLCGGITKHDGTVLDRGTGLARNTVYPALRRLEALGIVVAIRQQSAERGNETTVYRPNVISTRVEKLPREGKDRPTGRSKNVTRLGHGSTPQETAIQETLSKKDNGLATLWQTVLADLAEQMVPGNFNRWLARAALVTCADGQAVVGVPDQVSADQLARRFDPLVRRALADACGEAVTVRYQASEDG